MPDFNHKKAKDVPLPTRFPTQTKYRVYIPKTDAEKFVCKYAYLNDFEIFIGNTDYPNANIYEQKIFMPYVKNFGGSYDRFFSTLCHEVAHIIPYCTNMREYSESEEEIVTEMVSMRLFQRLMGRSPVVAQIHSESREYVKQYKQICAYMTVAEVRKLVRVSRKRYQLFIKTCFLDYQKKDS